MTTTTGNPNSTSVPIVAITTNAKTEVRGAVAQKAYNVLRDFDGTELTTEQVADLLHDELTYSQVRSALIGMGKSPGTYPHVHRVARGVYLYDQNRPRTWHLNPANTKGARRAAAKRRRNILRANTSPVASPPVVSPKPTPKPAPKAPSIAVQAKKTADQLVVPAGPLRLVEDAVVMQDDKGNLFVVRVTPV